MFVLGAGRGERDPLGVGDQLEPHVAREPRGLGGGARAGPGHEREPTGADPLVAGDQREARAVRGRGDVGELVDRAPNLRVLALGEPERAEHHLDLGRARADRREPVRGRVLVPGRAGARARRPHLGAIEQQRDLRRLGRDPRRQPARRDLDRRRDIVTTAHEEREEREEREPDEDRAATMHGSGPRTRRRARSTGRRRSPC